MSDAASPHFTYTLQSESGAARAGQFTTPHGVVHTPTFMPVGTAGAVKAMTPLQVKETGAEIILGNTYHLALRPGEATVKKLGGLHEFTRWSGPILTDSGGFQVFSLPKTEISDHGVRFANELSGESMELTPERSIQIQNDLGADIIMAFDECTPFPATEKQAASGVRRTTNWMERCIKAHARTDDQALFAIVQGSTFQHLREQSAQELIAMDLPGYAIGGVSVGEGHELLCEITSYTAPLLPKDKPRYLMGVGMPEDIVAAIGYGIDMFDCVIPTRFARSATAFTSQGKIRLTHRRYRRDAYPIDTSCDCSTCAGGFSRAYLNHLFAANEVLSAILLSVHNVRFYERLVQDARQAILDKNFEGWRSAFLENYGKAEAENSAKAASSGAGGSRKKKHRKGAAK